MSHVFVVLEKNLNTAVELYKKIYVKNTKINPIPNET